MIFLSSATGFTQEAEFSIDKRTHKFPRTEQGEILNHTFTVTNTGEDSLIISDYKVTCSCTQSNLPEGPIAPGESFDLYITFDTKDKYYAQERDIYYVTNTKKSLEKLRIKVFVIEPKKDKL